MDTASGSWERLADFGGPIGEAVGHPLFAANFVDAREPVPEPATMLLFGTGLIGCEF